MQLKLITELGNHKYARITKPRQFGFTTWFCIDLLDEALWVPGMSCAILAHEQRALLKIFDIVKRGYDNLPPAIKPRTDADNTNELKFEQRYDEVKLDSTIYVSMKVRSGTVQKLHVTESAYIKERAELKAGSKQAVPIGGRITEETTGNGYNDYYDEFIEDWNRQKAGKPTTPMDYKAFFWAWFENPEYTLPGILDEPTAKEIELKTKFNVTDGQLIWRRWKMKELKQKNIGFGLSGEQLFKQEYPATVMEAFQSGSGSVFDLERLENTQPEDPKTIEQLTAEIIQMYPEEEVHTHYIAQVKNLLQKGVSIWRLPEVGRQYVIGVDPSDGDGADFGPIDVWGRTDQYKEQVAQFYGKLRPDELAELTKLVADFYNHAFVGIENNQLTTILFFIKIYDNYYSEIKIDKKTMVRTKDIGYSTNIHTRDVMIDEFNIGFEQDTYIIRSALTLSEMRTFVKKENGKREHADGKHDDVLFAAFIAIQMFKYNALKARAFDRGEVSLW